MPRLNEPGAMPASNPSFIAETPPIGNHIFTSVVSRFLCKLRERVSPPPAMEMVDHRVGGLITGRLIREAVHRPNSSPSLAKRLLQGIRREDPASVRRGYPKNASNLFRSRARQATVAGVVRCEQPVQRRNACTATRWDVAS